MLRHYMEGGIAFKRTIATGLLLIFCALILMSCGKASDVQTITTTLTASATAATTEAISTTIVQTASPVTMPAEFSQEFYLRTACAEYPVGTEEITVYFGKNDADGFTYDDSYLLYKAVGDDWQQIPFASTYGYAAVLHEAHRGDSSDGKAPEMSQTIRFQDVGDNLQAGNYTLVKEFKGAYAGAVFKIVGE